MSAPSAKSSSVTRLKHDSIATWKSYICFQLIARIAVYLRRRRKLRLGIGNMHPAGPQNFTPLLTSYEGGWNKYALLHNIHLDWFEPASTSTFASELGSNYFDWTTTHVLRFQPKHGGIEYSAVKRTVFYFNGGAFIDTARTAHSYICCVLAQRLDACVYMFPYELAPTGCAASQLPKVTDFYLRVSMQARKEGHEIIIAGDSAGGSITASLPQCIHSFAPMLLDRNPSVVDLHKLQPDQLFLISPLVTTNLTEPLHRQMAEIQPSDWWLSHTFLDTVAKLWLGSPSLQADTVSHFVSAAGNVGIASQWIASLPLRTDSPIVDPTGSQKTFTLLRESKVHVTLVCGTNDILHAHAVLFADACEQGGVSCTFIQGTGGVHVYPILGVVGNVGSEEALDLCVASILTAGQTGKSDATAKPAHP